MTVFRELYMPETTPGTRNLVKELAGIAGKEKAEARGIPKRDRSREIDQIIAENRHKTPKELALMCHLTVPAVKMRLLRLRQKGKKP